MIGLGLLLSPRLAVTLSLALLIWLPQVLTSDDAHTLDKRNIGVLARTGQLPYQQGKRYMASLARSGSLPMYVQKKLHPGMTNRNQESLEPDEKRYVGTLLRAGNLPFQFHAKRDAADAHDAEDDDRVRALEAETKALETVLFLESQLNVELLKEKLLSGEVTDMEEKRSLASLARSGGLYRGEDKRSVEALARAGYLPNSTAPRSEDSADEVAKRSVAALAKNGLLRSIAPTDGKRGGIGSLARNNLLPQKKDEDNRDELEALIQELILEDQEKRNIGSVARSYNLPSGKRNIGSLARGGAYSKYAGKRDDFEDYGIQDDKRNVGSLLKGRLTPLQEGKRYLGSLARNQKMPYVKKEFDFEEDKRTSPMALARTWNQPESLRMFGKRYWPSAAFESDDGEVQSVAKRYVAALLRQGPLPVGTDDTSERPEPEKEVAQPSEEKRHLGSVKAAISKRGKREAYLAPATDEYPMPVYQNSDLFDYDDLMEVMSGATAPQKRFLGSVARSGWFRDSNRGPARLVEKRHIGALARLGWLPQLRNTRYMRAGRATFRRVGKRSTTGPREDPTDGSTSEDDAPVWATPSDPEGRLLLDDDPAEGRLLHLRKLYYVH